MKKDLYIDVETFSSVDIMKSGAYKYTDSLDFEILILAYSWGLDAPTFVVDLAQGEQMPAEFIEGLLDPDCLLHAHNATFERLSFKAIGYNIPADRWRCSAVKSSYCGLPLSLDQVSKALSLGDSAKDSRGKALIRYFSIPCKPTKANGGRVRNLPEHDLDKWQDYKEYCRQDVVAEKAILKRLKDYKIPAFEQDLYTLDQKINDRGILIDQQVAINACKIDKIYSEEISSELKNITQLENPNSPAQLKTWLESEMKMQINSLDKKNIIELKKVAAAGSAVERVLDLRSKGSKTSIKKYFAMLHCLCADGRAHGLFQFYGAGRTGRWAGRLIQLQNLPQNKIRSLDIARHLVRTGNYAGLSLMYDDLGSILSQLIRTAFVATKGKTLAVADFSAIEARVIAWLSGEQWRIDVFETHGKIYEASASTMFNVPLESIGKGSDLRQKGKVAELALGYQGAVGALKQMGGEQMGLSEEEMSVIVSKWRKASPNIVALWADLEKNALLAVKHPHKKRVSKFKNLTFLYDGFVLRIGLPSGRELMYHRPRLAENQWGKTSLKYWGMDQVKKIWTLIDTYGGKLTENVVQAIARDLLSESMMRLDAAGYDIVMHVHDEIVAEIDQGIAAEETLERICAIMGEPIEWADGLTLTADGYLTEFYKKD